MSKGSSQRPTDTKKFSDGYDRIFEKRAIRNGVSPDGIQVTTDHRQDLKREDSHNEPTTSDPCAP